MPILGDEVITALGHRLSGGWGGTASVSLVYGVGHHLLEAGLRPTKSA